MIEFWDYLSQFLAVTAGFCAALRAYLKSRGQPWFLLTCFYGTFALGTLYWCGLTMMLAWCAMRGLVWAKRTENGRLRRFYGTVLAFIALEYALWTASCFWVSDTLTNPYFWFDFLLTLVLLLFLPAVRKA